jgi:hypothetical protein
MNEPPVDYGVHFRYFPVRTPMCAHPFVKGPFSASDSLQQIVNLRLREAASGEAFMTRTRHNAKSHQIQKRAAIFSRQTLETCDHCRFVSLGESTPFHLVLQMVTHSINAAGGEPGLEIVNGTPNRSVTILLQNIECIPETSSKEFLPIVAFQVLYQSHESIPFCRQSIALLARSRVRHSANLSPRSDHRSAGFTLEHQRYKQPQSLRNNRGRVNSIGTRFSHSHYGGVERV